VVGIDPSAAYVEYARAHIIDPRARFEVGSASALPLDDAQVDAAVTGLVLNFVPDAVQALAEMVRVTRPGGTVGAYVWDYAGQMQLMRQFWDAAGALDPRARELDEGVRFPLCRPEPLQALFTGAGLADVSARSMCRPASAISTTTGHRFLAGRPLRPGTRCRSVRTGAPSSASICGCGCHTTGTGGFRGSPAPGWYAVGADQRGRQVHEALTAT
jgi:SAM-dependent methyltransferase